MANANVEDITSVLESTRVSPSGVSFAGQSLKLDSVEDAKPVIDEINKCTSLQYLNLEGNTLGVEACKGIAIALEKHPEFKRALWKDMFTGRMKTEIPKALVLNAFFR
jgi:Ran GTPase-activating protein 1